MSQILSELGPLIGLVGPSTTTKVPVVQTSKTTVPPLTSLVVTATATVVPQTTTAPIVPTETAATTGNQIPVPSQVVSQSPLVTTVSNTTTATTIPSTESASINASSTPGWILPVGIIGALVLICIVGVYATNICLKSKKSSRLNRGVTLSERRPSTALTSIITPCPSEPLPKTPPSLPRGTPQPLTKDSFTTIPRRSHRGSDASMRSFGSGSTQVNGYQTPPPPPLMQVPQQQAVYVGQYQQQQPYYQYPQVQQPQYGYPSYPQQQGMVVVPHQVAQQQQQYVTYENVYGYPNEQQLHQQYRRGSGNNIFNQQ
ncbi:UNVERIFIED_CONTAM: hypothetical protein HDU68_005109 [Siphonaria sp. JEL0065]|nr:hypothetical protein HDU68_005109 [Siphonaria sp. JEL0065]